MFKITLLMLITASCLAVDAVNPTAQQICYHSAGVPEMAARGQAINIPPLRGENDLQVTIRLSRHHIIPYQTMRSFFNRLLQDQNHIYFQRLYNEVLRPAAEHSSIPLSALLHMHDIGTPEQVVLANLEGRITDQTVAQTIFMWLPFNIFIGPSPDVRRDDPGNAFERAARTIVGQLRIDELYGLYNEMLRYIRSETTPERVLESLSQLTRTNLLPYDFDPNHWIVSNNGQWFCLARNPNCRLTEYRAVRFEDYYRSNSNRFPRQASFTLPPLIQDDLYCLKSYANLKNPAQPVPPAKKVHYKTQHHKPCLEAAGITTATTLGTTSLAYITCLGLGGLYIPFLGWVSCALGSLTYGVAIGTTGAVVAATAC